MGTGAVFVGKECKEGKVQPETKQQVHWLEDGEKFLVDVQFTVKR